MTTFLKTFGLFTVVALATTALFVIIGHDSIKSINWTLDLLISWIVYSLLKQNGV